MNRDFKGIWIAKEIWLNKKLSMMEKVLFAEIDSLDNEDGCFASNDYFAEFFGITDRAVRSAIKGLIDKGMIKRAGFDGRRRTLRVVNNFQADRKETSTLPGRKLPPYNKEDKKVDNKENNSDLYNRTLKVFTDKQPYEFDFGIEGKQIKLMVEKALKRPDPEMFMAGVLNTFWKMTQTDKFYKKKAFLPRNMNAKGIWPDVVKAYQNTHELDPDIAQLVGKLYDKS